MDLSEWPEARQAGTGPEADGKDRERNMDIEHLRRIGETAAAGYYDGLQRGLPYPREWGLAYRSMYEHMPVRIDSDHLLYPYEPFYEAIASYGDNAMHGGVHDAASMILNRHHSRGYEVLGGIAERKKAQFPEDAAFIDELLADLRGRHLNRGSWIHSIPDVHTVLTRGFRGIRTDLEAGIAAADEKELPLLLALRDCADGVEGYWKKVLRPLPGGFGRRAEERVPDIAPVPPDAVGAVPQRQHQRKLFFVRRDDPLVQIGADAAKLAGQHGMHVGDRVDPAAAVQMPGPQIGQQLVDEGGVPGVLRLFAFGHAAQDLEAPAVVPVEDHGRRVVHAAVHGVVAVAGQGLVKRLVRIQQAIPVDAHRHVLVHGPVRKAPFPWVRQPPLQAVIVPGRGGLPDAPEMFDIHITLPVFAVSPALSGRKSPPFPSAGPPALRQDHYTTSGAVFQHIFRSFAPGSRP